MDAILCQILRQSTSFVFCINRFLQGLGLALALLQQLRGKGTPKMPQGTALLSPWLDITLSNPAISNFKHSDKILDAEVLRECGLQYAGDQDPKDPVVSPVYGDLNRLSYIKTWVSDLEILNPDCQLLHERLTAAEGSYSTLVIRKFMVHAWPIMPVMEAGETIREVAEFFIHISATPLDSSGQI